jgi:tetratricopeptide (TPR) repeat protein
VGDQLGWVAVFQNLQWNWIRLPNLSTRREVPSPTVSFSKLGHEMRYSQQPSALFSFFVAVTSWGILLSMSNVYAQDSVRLVALQGTDTTTGDKAIEQRIRELIEMLGSEQFASRQRAQMELELMGLDAFEALREAFDHPDQEVAAMARYLIHSAKVEWATENDPPLVRETLRNYDVRTTVQRKEMIDRLAGLQGREGWAPLCRIAKFEPSNSLAKYAALLLMSKRKELTPDDNRILVDLIEREVGQSRRDSVEWLQRFTRLLADPKADPKPWFQIAEDEHALLDSGSDDTFHETVQSLYEWAAILGSDNNHRDEALRMARGAVRIVGNDPMGLRNAAYWVIDHGFPELVEEMNDENQALFTKSAELTYCLAESFRARKMDANADEHAELAFKNNSVGMLAARDPRAYRYFRAIGLQRRGLFDWSEREYVETLKNTRLLDNVGLVARYFYSDMLHDIGRTKDAGDVWKEILEELEGTGEPYRQQLHAQMDLANLRDPAGAISQAYYYQGKALAEKGDIVQAKIKLNYAFDNDPDNADVLIAMYHLEGDEKWRSTVRQRIKACADEFQSQMIQKEQEMETGGPLSAANSREDLATMNNQYAWLISNTEGDLQLALRCSQRSLELQPNFATYLDTLGRCYYAVGDYENAVKYQQRAVELEPFAMSMKRQLQLFETTLQQKKEKP